MPNGIKGLDYMVREIAIFKLWSQAIQAMLKETLNIECNLRTVVEFGMVRRCRERQFRPGDRRHRVGAARSFRLLQCLVRQGRPAELFVLGQQGVPGADRTDRPGSRRRQALALIRQAEAIMEQDPPLLPISWEQINEIWYNYVKGHNPYEYFGIYDVVAWIRSGSTRREPRRIRRRHRRVAGRDHRSEPVSSRPHELGFKFVCITGGQIRHLRVHRSTGLSRPPDRPF